MSSVINDTSSNDLPLSDNYLASGVPFTNFPKEIDALIARMTSSTMRKVGMPIAGFDLLPNSSIKEVISSIQELEGRIQLTQNQDLALTNNKIALVARIRQIVKEAVEKNTPTTLFDIRREDDSTMEFSSEWFVCEDTVAIQLGSKVQFDPMQPPKWSSSNQEYEVVKITSGISDLKTVFADPATQEILGLKLVEEVRNALKDKIIPN